MTEHHTPIDTSTLDIHTYHGVFDTLRSCGSIASTDTSYPVSVLGKIQRHCYIANHKRMLVETEASLASIPSNKIGVFVARTRLSHLRDKLLTSALTNHERRSALVGLTAANDTTLAEWLANELSNMHFSHADPEWVASIVACAEQSQFANLYTRSVVRMRLRIAAQQLLETGLPEWERTTWAALRTFGSMLAPSRFGSIRNFLKKIGVTQLTVFWRFGQG